MQRFYAHSIDGKPPDEWHRHKLFELLERLEEHEGTVPG